MTKYQEIIVTGTLSSMPELRSMNDAQIKLNTNNVQYTIIINNEDTYRLLVCGYLGMAISVCGELKDKKEEHTEIIARKIDFLDFPGTGTEGLASFNFTYLFNKGGGMKREYTYLH